MYLSSRATKPKTPRDDVNLLREHLKEQQKELLTEIRSHYVDVKRYTPGLEKINGKFTIIVENVTSIIFPDGFVMRYDKNRPTESTARLLELGSQLINYRYSMHEYLMMHWLPSLFKKKPKFEKSHFTPSNFSLNNKGKFPNALATFLTTGNSVPDLSDYSLLSNDHPLYGLATLDDKNAFYVEVRSKHCKHASHKMLAVRNTTYDNASDHIDKLKPIKDMLNEVTSMLSSEEKEYLLTAQLELTLLAAKRKKSSE